VTVKCNHLADTYQSVTRFALAVRIDTKSILGLSNTDL